MTPLLVTPLRIFIGYDSREPVAYHVLAHSIIRRASYPVSITPLALNHLASWLYKRTRMPNESTEFSFTRFLVPHLSGYRGLSIFMDCDMLCLADVMELAGHWTTGFCAVSVVPHDYTPKLDTKFLGQVQTAYPRKNWSSLMVFNNDQCRTLTPDYVNTASAMDLHRLKWLDDLEIGALPLEWNYLVGEENQAQVPPRIIHYTNGGPWFAESRDCDYAEEWRREFRHMVNGDVNA